MVRGTSMLPTLVDGDRMLVRYEASARPGALAVVVLPGDVLALKRLARREPAGWWVERDNPRAGVDSWTVGVVPDVDVVAVALLRFWPLPSRLVPRPNPSNGQTDARTPR